MEAEIDDAALISIDSKGIDIRVRQGAQVWKTGDIDCVIYISLVVSILLVNLVLQIALFMF